MKQELSRVPRQLSESYNSNLMERLYEAGGAVMLDMIIYLSGHLVNDLFGDTWFTVEDFCQKMGYERTRLQRKLTKEQLKELFGKTKPTYIYVNDKGEEGYHPIETVFEAALYKLGKENIAFQVTEGDRTSYKFFQILTDFDIKTDFSSKKRVKRMYSAKLSNQIRNSVYSQYNLIETQDYRNLPDREGYRYFYLELSKMIFLVKWKKELKQPANYTLTVDQLAKFFKIEAKESRFKKTKLTSILTKINQKLDHTKFQFEYIKGPGQSWPYTVSFTFSDDTLEHFNERYDAVFIKNLYGDILWNYVGLKFNVDHRKRVSLVETIKKTPEEYEKFLSWAYSEDDKEIKEGVYRDNFIKIFGKNPEDFGLTNFSTLPIV